MEKIKTALKNKNIDHLYFFCGEEVFLSSYYLNQIKKMIVRDDQFDYSAFESENLDGLQEAVESVPVLSDRKMVVVKGLDFSAELKADDVEFLTELLETVPLSACLIFCCRTIKKNSKIYKLLSDKCTVCTFDRQKPAEVIRWLLKAARAKNINIDRDTAALLIEYAGVDMTTLVNELDKLAAYCGTGGTVTPDAVEKIVIKSVDAKIYYLLDAVLDGHSDKAFLLLSEFKAENEKPIYINASIMGTLKTLLEYAYLADEGVSPAAIADKLRLRPIQARKNAGYVKKISKRFLENMLKRCIDLDMQMKRGADGFAGLSLIIGEMLLKR